MAILLSACGGTVAAKATATIPATAKATPSRTSTIAPSATAIILPSDTPVPGPVSVSGMIRLSTNGEESVFVTLVELRRGTSFDLIARQNTQADGTYTFEDLPTGTFELWVQITTRIEMPPGCADIAPPNDSWKIGIKFDEDKALTAEHAYLSKALSLAETLRSSDLVARGFYLVSEPIKLVSGANVIIDATMFCQ